MTPDPAAPAGAGTAAGVAAPAARAVRASGLEEERDFLLASLEDLEAEHEAGDIDEDDYAELGHRYRAQLAAILRAVDRRDAAEAEAAAGPGVPGPGRAGPNDGEAVDGGGGARTAEGAANPSPTTRPSRGRRRWLAYAGTALVLAGTALALVLSQTGQRLSGDPETGSQSLSVSQQVTKLDSQAEALEESGDAAGALALYAEVLRLDAGDVLALAETGWLYFSAGVNDADHTRGAAAIETGQRYEVAAVEAGPTDAGPHLYLGEMYFFERQPRAAVVQFDEFLGDGPTIGQIDHAARTIARAFAEAHVKLPAIVPVPPATGTTQTTT